MPRCEYHKIKFEVKYFNQKFCLSDLECTKAFNESVKIAKEKQNEKNKQSLEIAKNERDYDKKLKASLINTRVQLHSYIRERDKHKHCISCGTQWSDTFEAGHHYSANSFITLKYNLDNIHGQCFYCNNKLEGNFQNYALNLPERIGKQAYDELVKLASIDKQFSKVWNIENLKEVREIVKKERKK